MQRKYDIVIEPGENGWDVVTVPALPGCITQGKTFDEAKVNAKEAIELIWNNSYLIITSPRNS